MEWWKRRCCGQMGREEPKTCYQAERYVHHVAAANCAAFVRKPLPVLSIASSERDHLIMAGTELLSSEAHIIFW